MRKRKTTKEKILEVLKKEDRSSIKDLAEYIAISEVAIRRHINDLIRQRFVQEEEVKQEIGRPYYVYSLTGKGHRTFPNQYEELPVEMLQDLETLYGKKAIKDLLKLKKNREKEEMLPYLEDKDFDEKVEKFIELLEEKGYMIEYKKTEEGHYEIKNYHCPIYNVSSQYNIVCQNEKEMYQSIFPDSEITDLSCMSKGCNHCFWVITNPDAKQQVVEEEKAIAQ